jgi:hypothetical protein
MEVFVRQVTFLLLFFAWARLGPGGFFENFVWVCLYPVLWEQGIEEFFWWPMIMGD